MQLNNLATTLSGSGIAWPFEIRNLLASTVRVHFAPLSSILIFNVIGKSNLRMNHSFVGYFFFATSYLA